MSLKSRNCRPWTPNVLGPLICIACLMGCGAGYAWAAAQASIAGRVVVAGQDTPLAGVRIVLQASGRDCPLETVSDAKGRFRFPALDSGAYALEAEADGYFPTQYELALRPRQPLSITLELTAATAPREEVTVVGSYTDIDPSQAGSAQVFLRSGLDELPASSRRNLSSLVENYLPGAVVGHDNFLHFRGNELSLHQFINGVSFLDNPHEHFSAPLSPRIFEAVNFIGGGFSAEFGNRFGGILDIATRSGSDLGGHGSLSVGIGTQLNHDTAFEYGGSQGRFGYYFFVSGFESGRFLNPPTSREIHDLGKGGSFAAQFDYQGDRYSFKLLLMGGGSNFELPNTQEEAELGRNAFRRIRSQTAILSWQRILSPRAVLSTSFYQRTVSDRLLGTTDSETPFGEGSRSTLTTGAKSDLAWSWGIHQFKAGIDVALFRLRESFNFDPRDDDEDEEGTEGEEATFFSQAALLAQPAKPGPNFPLRFSSGAFEAFSFRGRDLGGQVSLYIQDRISIRNRLTLDLGVRWDQINLVGSEYQVSPRAGLAYHFPSNHSVIHFSYNRLFVPPPLEYAVMASYLGNEAAEEEREEGNEVTFGNVRPYTQDYFEAGWARRLHDKLTLEVNAYHHRGDNAFETAEISNTRLFMPVNFGRAKASGAEITLRLRQLEELGISGHIHYAASRTHFFGPVTGGFPSEELEAGQRISPAFDQTHTANASIFYRNHWRDFWAGFNLRYGSGTPAEEEVEIDGEEFERVFRLDEHLTADFSTGLALWSHDLRRLEFEFNIINLSDNIYAIGKESEATPIQFAPRRTVSGRLTWRF